MVEDNEVLANLIASTGRVEGKLDALMETWKQAHFDNEKRHGLAEDRIAHVERKVNIGTGIISFFTFIVAPVLTIFNIHK